RGLARGPPRSPGPSPATAPRSPRRHGPVPRPWMLHLPPLDSTRVPDSGASARPPATHDLLLYHVADQGHRCLAEQIVDNGRRENLDASIAATAGREVA